MATSQTILLLEKQMCNERASKGNRDEAIVSGRDAHDFDICLEFCYCIVDFAGSKQISHVVSLQFFNMLYTKILFC